MTRTTDADITRLPLSRGEEARLVELEAVVEAGLDTFVTVGNALAAILEARLYRATHSTFDAYVKDRFGIGRAYAYRKIEAARVAEVVSPIGDIPNESQARELSGLDDAAARDTFQKAVAESAGRPTAKDIRAAREAATQRPAPPRHKSLPARYDHDLFDLDHVVRKLEKHHNDDRFRVHRGVLAGRHARLLTELADRVHDLAIQLAVEQPGQATLPGSAIIARDVVLVVGPNTTVVKSGAFTVSSVLRALGIPSMADKTARKVSFPSARVADVQAALERDGLTVVVEPGGWSR